MWYVLGMIIVLTGLGALLAIMAVMEDYIFKPEDKWFVLLFTVVWPLFVVLLYMAIVAEYNERHPSKTKRGVWF